MKITGARSYIKFDLENGYIIKAEGELLADRRFIVYTNTMKYFEKPHENEQINLEQISKIIKEVQSMESKALQIIFE